ncbi:MAG TPA: hypothetical protein VJP80_04045 [Candidatus Saccharimonadales bacterium]|nr:hypothetical protein [Candidatus Saccharimonadales bacterium]
MKEFTRSFFDRPGLYADAASQHYIGELAVTRATANPLDESGAYFSNEPRMIDGSVADIMVNYEPSGKRGPMGDIVIHGYTDAGEYQADYTFRQTGAPAQWTVEINMPLGSIDSGCLDCVELPDAGLDHLVDVAFEDEYTDDIATAEATDSASPRSTPAHIREFYDRSLADVTRRRNDLRGAGLLRLTLPEAKCVAELLDGDPARIQPELPNIG